MSVTLEVAVGELRKRPLADPNGHLKPQGRQEVLQEIEHWKERGLVAYVLVVDRGDSFAELLGAWERLGLDANRDLLLIFDTRDWVARGWGLEPAQLRRALADARPTEPRTVFSRQLIAGLGALSRLAKPSLAGGAANDSAQGLSFVSMLGGVGVLAAGAVVALSIRRRNQLAQAGVALRQAQASAERTYTELILACEELPVPEDGTELQLRAAELKRRLDQVVAGVRERPATGNDPVRIGEIRQLEDELAALRSTALQKQKERP